MDPRLALGRARNALVGRGRPGVTPRAVLYDAAFATICAPRGPPLELVLDEELAAAQPRSPASSFLWEDDGSNPNSRFIASMLEMDELILAITRSEASPSTA